jgi:Domain of unknown function (DUF892)
MSLIIEKENQIERINECFSLLGKTARAKPCKGMTGLVEEGQEVMVKGEKQPDAAADLALIAVAQRVGAVIGHKSQCGSWPGRPNRPGLNRDHLLPVLVYRLCHREMMLQGR